MTDLKRLKKRAIILYSLLHFEEHHLLRDHACASFSIFCLTVVSARVSDIVLCLL